VPLLQLKPVGLAYVRYFVSTTKLDYYTMYLFYLHRTLYLHITSTLQQDRKFSTSANTRKNSDFIQKCVSNLLQAEIPVLHEDNVCQSLSLYIRFKLKDGPRGSKHVAE
jgi:hypothetical protein